VNGPDESLLRSLTANVHTIASGTTLWRIHGTAGAHPVPWNALRTFGPIPGARWDPHPEPHADYAPLGVAYLGMDQLTCLAEVFQEGRFVDVYARAPFITAFVVNEELRLIDISTPWFVKAGGTTAVATGPKETTRQWARAFHTIWPDADGVLALSAVAPGRHVTALWKAKFPPTPIFTSPLSNPAIASDINALAQELGYGSNIA